MQTYKINLHGEVFDARAENLNNLRVNLLKSIRWDSQHKYAEVYNKRTGKFMGGLSVIAKRKPMWYYPRYFMEEQQLAFVNPKTGRLTDKHQLGERPTDL